MRLKSLDTPSYDTTPSGRMSNILRSLFKSKAKDGLPSTGAALALGRMDKSKRRPIKEMTDKAISLQKFLNILLILYPNIKKIKIRVVVEFTDEEPIEAEEDFYRKADVD